MLSFFILSVQIIKIPLPGLIIASLFLIIFLIYLFIYLRFKIVKKSTFRLQQENIDLKTELSRINEETENLKNQLARKTIFISNISNEIKTPLNSIFGFAELLSDRNISNNERINYANMILRNANNLLTIMTDIVDITKIGNGLMSLSNDYANLNHFIDELERYLKKELQAQQKQSIKVGTVKFLDGESSCFYTDLPKIRKIMTNLINNAIKNTTEGFIELGYKLLDKDFILFYVSDSGIGIEKEYQKDIFDEFVQVISLKSKVPQGSGLGLAVAKRLAELMGGKMWIESVKNSGSTFYFTIPCEPCSKEINDYQEEPDVFSPNCWKGRTVLIVDDYRDIYFYLSETLENTGLLFLYADSGQKAIDMCREHPEIELVLMDIQMPEMSGIDATKGIREFRKGLPIIAQTAYAQADDFDTFLDAGFNDMITKPIGKNILLKKMSKYLNK